MFQYIICVGSRFAHESRCDRSWAFQYIICVGSSWLVKTTFTSFLGFNTSYVSVQEERADKILIDEHRFNTSYVSVQGVPTAPFMLSSGVSIHHMCRFKISSTSIGRNESRFQYIICVGSRKYLKLFLTSFDNVSIHHMCRFKPLLLHQNGTPSSFQYIICVGSRDEPNTNKSTSKKFQYIICVGSRNEQQSNPFCSFLFQYIICVGSSVSGDAIKFVQELFQYIICVGSRARRKNKREGKEPSFNTSYVSVQVFTWFKVNAVPWFQYIICVGSRTA